MQYREISKLIGNYLFYLSVALFIPFLLALYYEFITPPHEHPQPHSTLAFFYSLILTLFLACCFSYLGRYAEGKFYRREGIVIIASIWLISALVGAFPYYFSGTFDKPLDAYFEAISGFTTTGSTVMSAKNYDAQGNEVPIHYASSDGTPNSYTYYGNIKPVVNPVTGEKITGIEAVSKAILFWRSFSQWLGGLGIVVIFVAILPALGVGGKVLSQTETTGPTKESLTPRIKDSGSILWKIYLSLSIFQIFFLITTNEKLHIFDALTITFSTISTGGFSILNDSIGGYHNAKTEWVVIIFMILGSLNFSLYFHVIKGKLYKLYDPELILYMAYLIGFSGLLVMDISGHLHTLAPGISDFFTLPSAIRQALFQVVSIQSTTGYSTSNFSLWPFFSQTILLVAMFIGGMSGSTAGGMKVSRNYILNRFTFHKTEQIFRPDVVRTLKIQKRDISPEITTTVLCFFFIVIGLTLIATLTYLIDDLDPITAFSLAASSINNIGVGLGAVNPTQSLCFLSNFSKIVTILWMVMGRIEFFAILILFIPAFWKKR